jgi:2'-hydroxyisoflavone reductase
MSTTRRSFICQSVLAGGAASLGIPVQSAEAEATSKAAKKLKLLVLGGTGLIGPPMVEYAIARGHEVTLFNRGTTNTHLFPELEKLKGDRKDDLSSIEAEIGKGRRWDAVIDNPASIPAWVTRSAGLLKSSADLYMYTSSMSAYASHATPDVDETAALGTIDAVAEAEVSGPRQITGENFGPLKARCEEEARRFFPDASIVVRPGLIVGPGDRSDRFTYWPVRIAEGGEVLAPGAPDDPVQFIDCRDLGEWYVRLVENRSFGTYNGVGPRSSMSLAEMLYGMRATVDREISFTWVDAGFLSEHEVQPWMHMPVWIPPAGDYAGFASRNNDRALEAGLTFRPLCETTMDTVAWWNDLPEERRQQPRAGLSREREKSVLEQWKGRT